jgi:hypothetical protein
MEYRLEWEVLVTQSPLGLGERFIVQVDARSGKVIGWVCMSES